MRILKNACMGKFERGSTACINMKADEDDDMEDDHADSENDNVENKEDVEDAEKDNDEDNITANETFINPSQLEAESVEFDVFVKCKDHWLRNDQIMYMSRLRSVPEVETVENMWITPINNYKIGSYLSTSIKFQTKFGKKI